MLKNISNLGIVLNNNEQKGVTGGKFKSLDTFACYCNGVYHCEADSIADCIAECA
ncbi:hypothetical protein [uncultured Tenacibaculum sp.]|uniref:hypothetical protein n=1 Tax=uncultured Tenacibaculum sp. TaxID=174713 RepID=UPI0026148A0E|nr:hypothetical protein [uncultured Tenacibaculum sp.]